MNIFWFEPFDGRPVKEVLRLNAQQHPCVYLNKLQVEGVQILSSANIIHGYPAPYAMSHGSNALNLYCAECLENWILIYWYVEALEEERHFRYNTNGIPHKSYLALKSMTPPPTLKRNGIPKLPPLMMPDMYKGESLVNSYRNYFIAEKQHLADFGNREEPWWFNMKGILLPNKPRKLNREQELRTLANQFKIPKNGTRIIH